MASEAVANGLHRARLEPVPTAATPADRVARGKAARAAVPRDSHATFQPAANRPDPVSLLERQAASRVPDLLPIRYGRMLASPFAFFRGAALPMASDLAATPVSGLTVQACGDAHGRLRLTSPPPLAGRRSSSSGGSIGLATGSARIESASVQARAQLPAHSSYSAASRTAGNRPGASSRHRSTRVRA